MPLQGKAHNRNTQRERCPFAGHAIAGQSHSDRSLQRKCCPIRATPPQGKAPATAALAQAASGGGQVLKYRQRQPDHLPLPPSTQLIDFSLLAFHFSLQVD
jgi:hypothetical protein